MLSKKKVLFLLLPLGLLHLERRLRSLALSNDHLELGRLGVQIRRDLLGGLPLVLFDKGLLVRRARCASHDVALLEVRLDERFERREVAPAVVGLASLLPIRLEELDGRVALAPSSRAAFFVPSRGPPTVQGTQIL